MNGGRVFGDRNLMSIVDISAPTAEIFIPLSPSQDRLILDFEDVYCNYATSYFGIQLLSGGTRLITPVHLFCSTRYTVGSTVVTQSGNNNLTMINCAGGGLTAPIANGRVEIFGLNSGYRPGGRSSFLMYNSGPNYYQVETAGFWPGAIVDCNGIYLMTNSGTFDTGRVSIFTPTYD